MRQYRIRWTAGKNVETYFLRAGSEEDARIAFGKVPGVRILSVEPVQESDDDAASIAHPTKPPPRGPLTARESHDNLNT